MSTSLDVTVVGPPSTSDVLQQILSMMSAQSGVVTDFNIGSQVRTASESVGAVIEQQGISAQTLVLQGIAISAMSLFNISPSPAIPAQGTETFATSNLPNPPPATQAVQIPAGTLVQTAGGVQFATTEPATLQPGASSIDVPIQAVKGGVAGNVPAGAINQLLSGLSYPLSVTNASPTADGLDQQSASQGLSLLASKVASIGIGSPVGIANGVIGVTVSGSSEAVRFATCYEPWIANNTQEAGFTVYIDNGSGAASAALIAAVQAYMNGNQALSQPGNRPTGMPFSVAAVQAVFANLAVTGVLNSLANVAAVSGAIGQAIQAYFSLPFGSSAEQPQISAAIANAAMGTLTSLTVELSYASDPSTVVSVVSGLSFNRVILQGLSVSLPSAS